MTKFNKLAVSASKCERNGELTSASSLWKEASKRASNPHNTHWAIARHEFCNKRAHKGIK